jgi:gluconokinase
MIAVLMGVSGCGKTTVGRLLCERLGWRFLDADDFHPPANVEKMRSGVPLNDEDRWPWLDRLNELLRDEQAAGENCVLACSALKQKYRDRLAAHVAGVRWVHLKGTQDLIAARLQARRGHYMPPTLLQSQFAALEPPAEALVVDISPTPQEIAQRLAQALTTPQPL